MKLEMSAVNNAQYEYTHYRCVAEGTPEEKDEMNRVMKILWDNLAAGKKCYARLKPEIQENRDFDKMTSTIIGVFRMSVHKTEIGEMIMKKSSLFDANLIYGFGLPLASKESKSC